MLFQIIFFLRPVWMSADDLGDRSCCCARAIAVPIERLLLKSANAYATNRGTPHYRLLRGRNPFSGRSSSGGFYSRKVEND
jgi:hypothetical protein